MQSTQPSVAVIGGGSFGTAVVKMVSENLGSCHWWMHNEESAAHIREYWTCSDWVNIRNRGF